MIISECAGGVVLNDKGEVVVVSQNNDSWSLPKGHLEMNEEPLDGARREIAEEAGIAEARFVKELGTYERYRLGKHGVGEDQSELKRIRMFLFHSDVQELRPTDPENPEARWVPVSEVPELLTHPKDKDFFRSIVGSLTLN